VAENLRADLDGDFGRENLDEILSREHALAYQDDQPFAPPITLPPHRRCVAHTLNLVAETADKFLVSMAVSRAGGANVTIQSFARTFSTALAKCTALWHRQRRTTLVSE